MLLCTPKCPGITFMKSVFNGGGHGFYGQNNHSGCGRRRGHSSQTKMSTLGKVGHVVQKCYHRFDISFIGVTLHKKIQGTH